MVSKNIKIDISIQVILVLALLWFATYGVLLFNIKTKVDYNNSILLRKSIEKVCGEDRIINVKVADTYKGHTLGTYHYSYSDFDLTKPLSNTEAEKVEETLNEEYREIFSKSNTFLSRFYSIDTIKLNNDDKRFLWLSVNFKINLPPTAVIENNSKPIFAVQPDN